MVYEVSQKLQNSDTLPRYVLLRIHVYSLFTRIDLPKVLPNGKTDGFLERMKYADQCFTLQNTACKAKEFSLHCICSLRL
jgi:hypothetical protein